MSESGREATPVSLGTHSARGFVWFFAGTTGAKLINLLSQVILAYYLTEGDWKIFGLATTFTAFIQVIEQAGVGDVLVFRRKFHLWAIPAFWLALSLGLVSTLLIAVSGPIVAAIYDKPQLVTMLLIFAPGSLFTSLTVVPRAQLSRELRFRAIATANMLNFSGRWVLTVVFAMLGSGPMSFVAPVPIINALTAAILWYCVRPRWSWHVQLSRWRYLIADSSRVLTAELQRAFLDQSDYMFLGLFHVPLMGLYVYGFSFSIQIVQFLSSNLMNILFPAFTKLNDRPAAQYQAFLRSQRIMAMVGVSACLLQAAIWRPLVHLIVRQPSYYPSIVVMEILTLGMALRMVSGSSYALLKSQGRFRTILWNRWGFVALQVAGLLAVLLPGGGIVGVAVVVAVVSSIMGPVSFYTAVQPYGGGWRDVAAVLVRPLMCGTVAVGAAWLVAQYLVSRGAGDFVQLAVTLVLATILNLAAARIWMRPVWDDLWSRVMRLRSARRAA